MAGKEKEGGWDGRCRHLQGGCEVKTGRSSVHVGRSDVLGLGGGHVETGERSVEMVESVGGGGGGDG